MVIACLSPSTAPTGATALASAMAVRTSSMLRPMEASSVGLTRTRMAGCSAPLTSTWAMPGTCEMRWATTVSAAS